jgi:DinB family protein
LAPQPGTTVDPTIAAALARLTAASQAVVGLRPRIEAGEPWPLAERFGAEPEAHWGPREVLAHCAEMLPYWIGEIERILAGPEPAPYGRTQTDALRIAIIERDRTLPIRELLARIADGTARYARRLAELTAADVGRRGLHPTRGEQTIEQLLEQTVVGHLEGHLVQLREALAERG